MRYISDEKLIHAFTPSLSPIVTIDEGETVTVHTVDCYCNVLKADNDPWLELRKHVPGPNPATGPIEVKGAMPGDTLAVEILDIRPIEFGMMNVRPGAMLALGDVHALMGDGEVGICGLECAAEVDLKCHVIHGVCEDWPVVRDAQGCYRVNCSAENLDAAAYLARVNLLKFLKRRIHTLTNDQLIMLMSLAGDLEIAQIVDPLVTCRMGIRPGYLPELEF